MIRENIFIETRNGNPAFSALRGNWIATTLFGIYFLSLWPAPQLPITNLGWEVAIALAVGAYVAQNRKINLGAAKVLVVVLSLDFAGAVISLLRAPNFDQSLWNTVGLAVNFIIMLLFITTIATQQARKGLLIILIGNGLLWTAEIQRLVDTYGTLAYSTFQETGSNKNAIGFFLALGIVSLLYFSIFFRPKLPWGKLRLLAVRTAFGVAGIWFFFNMSLIYARTALISTALGIVTVFYVSYTRYRKDHRVPVRPIVYLTVLVLLGMSQVSHIVSISPRWIDMSEHIVESVSSGDIGGISESRTNLLQKGWAVIGDNPFLGVGVNGSRPAYSNDSSTFGVALIHNSYLAQWADKGILGLISYIVWLILFVKITRSMFWTLPDIDRLWLVLYVPLVWALMFIDFTSVNVVFLLILAGIYYERVILTREYRDELC